MRTLWLLATVLALLVAAPAAHAADRAEIIADCNADGDLDGNYTPSEIRDARNNIPTDIDQYSDCRDVLSRALGGSGTGAVGGGGAPGGGGVGGGVPGSAPGGGGAGGQPLTADSPEEQAALQSAGTSGDAPVQVGSEQIVPGASGFAAGAVRNTMPPTLVAMLILLALAAVAALVPSVRRRVLARRLA